MTYLLCSEVPLTRSYGHLKNRHVIVLNLLGCRLNARYLQVDGRGRGCILTFGAEQIQLSDFIEITYKQV